MSKITITNTKGYYECGDGCCTDWIDDTVIEIKHTELLRTSGDLYAENIVTLLEALGHEVELVEIDTTEEDMELYR